MECGGKPERDTALDHSAPTFNQDHIRGGQSKAPSSLRFAGALQIRCPGLLLLIILIAGAWSTSRLFGALRVQRIKV